MFVIDMIAWMIQSILYGIAYEMCGGYYYVLS